MQDYFHMRNVLGLAQFPDDMVTETATAVEAKLFAAGVSAVDLAWIIESAHRMEPKVHSLSVTDSLRAREGIG